MKRTLCEEAGLLIQTENGVVLNEEKLFKNLSYQECLDLDFQAIGTIDRGQVRISDVENYLEKRAVNS